jgi:hypothetical protein
MNNPFSTGPTDNFAPNLGQNDYNRITQTYITQRPLWLRCWFLEAISVMPGNEYASIAQFMTTSTSAYSADPATAANHANLWALAACAYVIESYWRTYPGYENVHLRVRAIPRAKDAGYHLLYAAMDFYLEYPADFAGEQAGALQVWASLYKLAKEGRIPYGGRGLYLNVNPETGIKGTAFSEAGSPSKSNCQYPPGGSSWTHYDIRGMWGITTRKNSQGSFLPGFFTSWVGTDWNGDGSDEITLSNSFSPPKSRTQNGGVEDTAAYTWANVADSDFKLLEEYVSGTKSTQAPGVAAVMRARKARSDYLDVEKARDPVRAVLRSYFESNGTNDKWLKPVTTRVPNMFQVFELEQLLGASLNPITPYIAPDKKNFKAKLFFAKDIAGQIINAPVIVFFGGARVNGQSAGTYMETYASYLKGRNHLVIAENDKVTYGDVEPFITEAQFHAAGHPSTLFIFSNGVVPTRSWVAARGNVVPNSDFSVVCLVDAFLGGNPAIPVGQRTRANEITDTFLSAMGTAQSLYRFFYTEVWNMTGNGMYQQTRDRILGGGSYTGMTNLYRQLVPKGNATTDIEWHMDANRVAIQYLLDSGLAK